jgi:hypothetical protein
MTGNAALSAAPSETTILAKYNGQSRWVTTGRHSSAGERRSVWPATEHAICLTRESVETIKPANPLRGLQREDEVGGP